MNEQQQAIIDARIEELQNERVSLNERLLIIPSEQEKLVNESNEIMVKLIDIENQINELQEAK